MSASKTNPVGRTRQDYTGSKSTLCTGCGHDSITHQITTAYYQSGVDPFKVSKLSGIGCSSKTPTYFMRLSHGFNSIHGRMAPVATGVAAANPNLQLIGVSGDGDTASIGLGGFTHLVRRNVPIVYIIENNGVYGLTKGQFSATAELKASAKTGELNEFSSLDPCALAIQAGCGFVARSFSGDAKQMVPLISAAIRYPGTAVIDVISPCVTFNNHENSHKSYNYVKEHKINLQEMGFIQPQEEIEVDYSPGETIEVKMHDDSILTLKKLDESFDFKNPISALKALSEAESSGQVITGLLYYKESKSNFQQSLSLSKRPLSTLTAQQLRPSPEEFEKILSEFS